MKTGLLVSILAFAAASCVALQESAPGPAEPMTVAEVSARIASLHGQTVRMRGEVNNCTSLTCKICDGPKDEDACLGLALHADSHAAGYLVEELYRFATITIDASIDAACEVGYDADRFSSKAEAEKPNAEGRHVVVICTDRATSVRDARIVSVDARKPASLGRFDMYEGSPLQEADTDAFQKIETFLSTLPWIEDLEELQLKLYENPEPWEGASESYYLCECFEDSCEERWPTWSGHADTRSPANPYVCTRISRIGDNWVMS